METLEIIKLIRECNTETKNDMAKRFDDYNKSMSLLFTSEIGEVKSDIKDLTSQVTEQNHSVRNLKEWRVGAEKDLGKLMEDAKDKQANKRKNTLFIIGQIVIIVLAFVGIYFNNKSTVKDINTVKTELLQHEKQSSSVSQDSNNHIIKP